MSNITELLIVVAIITFQTFMGYIGNKYLGSILPISFLLFIFYLIVAGYFTLSFRGLIMPPLGFFTLIGIYKGGQESKNNKIKKELDKMKAQDRLDQ